MYVCLNEFRKEKERKNVRGVKVWRGRGLGKQAQELERAGVLSPSPSPTEKLYFIYKL